MRRVKHHKQTRHIPTIDVLIIKLDIQIPNLPLKSGQRKRVDNKTDQIVDTEYVGWVLQVMELAKRSGDIFYFRTG